MRKRYYIYLIMLIAVAVVLADLMILGHAEQNRQKAKIHTPTLVK